MASPTAPATVPSDTPPPPEPTAESPRLGTAALTLGALGVVFGDIGTSPLYAFREAILASGASAQWIPHEAILGVLSLIIWTLVVIVTLKYVVLLMRADNDGEGGTLSLLALAQRAMHRPSLPVVLLGILGAGLFYGDSAITPAISVLSAIEGMELVIPHSGQWVVPISLAIILGLFAVQKRGTAAVARFFGPVMLIWFTVLAAGGISYIAQVPQVLLALNPIYAVLFLADHLGVAFAVMGAVFLAVTGGEALYADMGHFGRKPIRLAWFLFAFPALVLNYLGQGAMLMVKPEALDNPFFLMFPSWALAPVVVLATMATVIASQAVITGAYSLTQQAIQLKLLPRMRIRHTSEEHEGQIYLPAVNGWLLFGVVALVLMFGSSSALASAYGIAVTGTMVVTALMAMIVARHHWRLPLAVAIGVMLPFLLIDLGFLAANMTKVLQGGYIPLGVALLMVMVMWSWIRGSALLLEKDRETEIPLASLIGKLESGSIATVQGTGVFLTPTPDLAPAALLHSLKHFKALHEQNVILTVTTADSPRVPPEERVKISEISPRFRRVDLVYGYAEDPNVPQGLLLCRKKGWKFDIMSTSFILSRRSFRHLGRSAIPYWQSWIYILLARNAATASDYFRIPAGRVVEIGTQVNL